jgi:Glu-tRNA(Gln) amidotransferase subunit E-like FAD-binding protein
MTAGDPESYWRPLRPGETVYVLQDIIQGPVIPQDVSPVMAEQGSGIISETADKLINREQVTEIVERIIPETYVHQDPVNERVAPQPVSSLTNEQVIIVISETTERLVKEQTPVIIERIISEATEKMVRDLAPEIIERVIREEIEKLKRANDQ